MNDRWKIYTSLLVCCVNYKLYYNESSLIYKKLIMKFLNIFSVDTLKKNVQEISSRFPVSVLVISIMSILFFVELHYHSVLSDNVNENIGITILSLILTFVFSVWVYLTTENNDVSKIKRNVFQLIPVIFWISFFLTFSSDIENFENIIFFLLTLVGIVSYLFFAPYFKNIILSMQSGDVSKKDKVKLKQSVFYTYFYNISVVILITSIFWGVMFALGAIWITAIDALFDLYIDASKTYWNWAIISLSLITPLFALTQIPQKPQFRENQFRENLFFSFLIKFVAIPFIVIYFLILYAYTIKVLLNFWDWPKWEVSWMVIGFSIFGYITYIFSYIFEKKNVFIKKFRSILPYAVVPQIFMLFYAIYLRLNQYDLTINRYFVVVFGLWLLVISLYYAFSKKKQLIFIPAILTLFTIIISIWPWGVYSLPESRQLERLKVNIKASWMVWNSTITQTEYDKYYLGGPIIGLKEYSDISQELSKNIYSWINYLCDFDSCNAIKKLFPRIYADLEVEDKIQWEKIKKADIERMELETNFSEYYTKESNEKRLEERKAELYRWVNKWEIITKVTETIKVKNYFPDKWDIPQSIYFWLQWGQEKFYPVALDDYDFMTTISDFNSYDNKDWRNKYIHAELDMKLKTISLKDTNQLLETVNISGVYDELMKKNKSQENSYNWVYTKEDLTFILSWDKYDYKLLFQYINLPNPEYIDPEEGMNLGLIDWFWNGFVLIKEK